MKHFTPPINVFTAVPILTAALAALVAMTLAATAVQATSSSVRLELEGRRVLLGCGPNHETALRIKASAGSATVMLGLRDAQSAAASLLQINDGSGVWNPFTDPTTVTITNGRKTVGVRAKASAIIRKFGEMGNQSAALLGLGNYGVNSTPFTITKGERWVFEIDPADSQKVIGSTYGGTENLSGGVKRNYGPQEPGIGIWVVVPEWRPQPMIGCAP